MSDLILFAVFPYLAVAVAIGGTIYRAMRLRDTLGARSSQLLESRLQAAGSLPWHWAILPILLAHGVAAIFPGAVGALLGSPARLYALEVLGLALGLLAAAGILTLLVRRLRFHPSGMDWLVLASLAFQAVSGVWVAIGLRWGSAWYLHTAVPWLASLARLDPQAGYVTILPSIARLHLLNAFLLIALFPFSRLVHAGSVPLGYLFRPPQVVSWRHVH